MADEAVCVSQQQTKPIKIGKWKIRPGNTVSVGRIILVYDFADATKPEQKKLKASQAGIIHKILAEEGNIVEPGEPLYEIKACSHPTIMNNMCAECGADLMKDDIPRSTTASIPMIHAIPELKVSEEQAQKLGQADSELLIKDRKLVLLVDLDQTLIHTTNDNIPPNIKDVYHFQLYGPKSPWYHTRLRPGTHNFLNSICECFELHICTFGARNYAHMIAMFLDPNQKFFSNRILSRDECFDPTSKKANLKALFPCGDDMVCIIDDREDVWSHASNLIHVKPYHFFQHTGDINAPPGLDKHEDDDKEGVDLTKMVAQATSKDTADQVKSSTAEPVENVENQEHAESDNETNKTEACKVNDEIKAENMETVCITNNANKGIEAYKDDTKMEISEVNEVASNEVEAPVDNSGGTNPDQKVEAPIDGSGSTDPNLKVEASVDNSGGTNADQKVEDPVDNSSSTDPDQKVEAAIDNSDGTNTDKKFEDPVDNSSSTDPEQKVEALVDNCDSTTDLNQKLNSLENIAEDNDKRENLTGQEEKLEPNKTPGTENNGKLKVVPNPSINEQNAPEDNLIQIEDPDDYLIYLECILRRIHRAYYELYDKMQSGKIPDLKRVIPYVKSRVLNGCKLVFSGLVPTHYKLEQSKAYQVARSLGAEVQAELDDKTTHLVAVRPGTAKVNAGRRKKHLKIVTPDWLWCCAERWEHVDERIFPLNAKGSKNRHPPPHCSSPEHVTSYPEHDMPALRKRTPSGRFMDTINPLMSFSRDDIADMDKEVEDILDDESDDSEEELVVAMPGIEDEDENDTDIEDVNLKLMVQSEILNSYDTQPDDGEREPTKEFNSEDDPNTEADAKRKRHLEDDENSNEELPSRKFRRGGDLYELDLDPAQDNDDNDSDSFGAPDEEDDREWTMMGAALEREFLSD